MKILEFKEKLNPIKKPDLLQILGNHQDFINGASDNLRMMKADGVDLSTAITGWKRSNDFLKLIRNNSSVTPEAVLGGAVDKALELLALIQKDTQAGPNVISKETVTIREVNALMIDSYMSFWADYLSRLMDMFTSMMVKKEPAEKVAQKPDLVFLDKELARFAEITWLLFERGGIIIKRYKASPKLVADEQTVDVLEQTKGSDAVLAMPTKGFGPHNFNPVFWWEHHKMEKALKDYERHTNSIKANAQKISYYQDLQRQQPSPANEQMISLLEDRIIKAQAAMEAIEARYA